MADRNNSSGKVISGIVLITFIAKIMGFCRELLLSYYFGATGISDAYLISLNIPGTLFTMVGTGLTTCFIPVFYAEKMRNKDTDQYTNRIMTIVFCISTFLICLVWLFTSYIVRLFASGFEGETLYYAIWFTRIGILSLYFSSMIYVYNSYLQANSLFIAQSFAAIPNSIIIMISIVLGSKFNIWILSIGSTMAVGVQLLILLPALRRTSYKFSLRFDWNDSSVHQFVKLMAPVIVGVSVNEINVLIDKTVASQVAIGGISALTYANSLIMFVQGGLVQPITTVFYPRITKTVSEKDHSAIEQTMCQAISMLLGLLIPITIGFFVLNRELVEALFARGAFDETAIKLTRVAVFFYSIGICFVGLRELVSRYYYANSNSKTPVVNTSIGVIVNIILNLLLSRYIGIGGLALSTSIAAVVTSMLLIYNSRKKVPSGKVIVDYNEVLKIILSSGLMGVICYLVKMLVPMSNVIAHLILPIGAGIIAYGGMGVLLKLKVVTYLLNMVQKRK